MAKIRMRTTSAGPAGVMLAGKEYTVDDSLADQLVPTYAEYIEPKLVRRPLVMPETATASKVERAVKTTRRR